MRHGERVQMLDVLRSGLGRPGSEPRLRPSDGVNRPSSASARAAGTPRGRGGSAFHGYAGMTDRPVEFLRV